MAYSPSSWINVTGTAAAYPSNGIGGTTLVAASSVLVDADVVVIDGFLLLSADAGATSVTVMQQDGVTAIVTLTFAAAQACPLYVPLGGPDGMIWATATSSGISVKTSNVNTTGVLFFRRRY